MARIVRRLWANPDTGLLAFPISAIIAIIGGVALTSLVYKERLDRYKISGILFGLAALCLTVFREQIAEAVNALLLQQ